MRQLARHLYYLTLIAALTTTAFILPFTRYDGRLVRKIASALTVVALAPGTYRWVKSHDYRRGRRD